ncbi:hypothetical protein [Limnospira fusiformis]
MTERITIAFFPTITLVDGVLPTVPDEARNKHQYPAMSGFV